MRALHAVHFLWQPALCESRKYFVSMQKGIGNLCIHSMCTQPCWAFPVIPCAFILFVQKGVWSLYVHKYRCDQYNYRCNLAGPFL